MEPLIRRLVVTVALATGVLGLVPSVWAQDPIHKMGRGMVNVLTGWLELPKQIQLGTQTSNPITGLAMGLVKGAGMTLLRSGVGLYETVTFPIPLPTGFASPYEQMALNDYAWE